MRIEFEGYEPFEAVLHRGKSDWIWGDLGAFGLIGIAVDAVSGAIYELTPDDIVAGLGRQGASNVRARATAGGIIVILVQRADSGWTRIGTARRH